MILCQPRPQSAGRVDFFLHLVSAPLPRVESARADLQPILKLLNDYSELLDQNGSVAKHLHMPLFSSRIEDRINNLFSCSRPQVVGLADDDNYYRGQPSWANLIQASTLTDHVELFDGSMYRCSFGDMSVEMSKSDCDTLSADVLRKLLQAPPEPEDVETEREARSQLIRDLTHLQEDISKSEGDIRPHKTTYTR